MQPSAGPEAHSTPEADLNQLSSHGAGGSNYENPVHAHPTTRSFEVCSGTDSYLTSDMPVGSPLHANDL